MLEFVLSLQSHQIFAFNPQQLVVLPRGITLAEEDILITTLDDVLCITCKGSKLHIFLDIQDIDLGYCSQVVESFATDKEHKYLQPGTS